VQGFSKNNKKYLEKCGLIIASYVSPGVKVEIGTRFQGFFAGVLNITYLYNLLHPGMQNVGFMAENMLNRCVVEHR